MIAKTLDRKLIFLVVVAAMAAFLTVWLVAGNAAAQDGNEPAAQEESSLGDGRAAEEVPAVSPAACVGNEDVALIQDARPWGSNANTIELTAQGRTWCILLSSQLNAANLSGHDVVLIANDQPSATYNNIMPGGNAHPKLDAFARAGGVVSAGLTDRGRNGGSWANRSFIGGLQHVQGFTNNNNIASAAHPIITNALPCGGGNCGVILDAGFRNHLDSWNGSDHGFFSNLPAGTTVILNQSGNNSRPVMIEYPWGSGRVIATMNTLEWRYDVAGNEKRLLANEIAYQIDVVRDPLEAIEAKLDVLEAKIDALKNIPGALGDINDIVTANNTAIRLLTIDVAALEAKADALELKADSIQGTVEHNEELLLGHIEATGEINDNFADLVANVVEMKRVHLQVIEINGNDGDSDDGDSDGDSDDDKAIRFLLASTEAGVLVDATLVWVKASDDKTIAFELVPAVAAPAGTGTGKMVVTVTLPKELKKAKLFEFVVEHGDHAGSSVVSTKENHNLGAGQ